MERLLTFTLFCLILSCAAGAALAEDSNPKNYIRMEETEIIGMIEHPEITYIIPKTRIQFRQIPLERDFTSEATRFFNPMVFKKEARSRRLVTGP